MLATSKRYLGNIFAASRVKTVKYFKSIEHVQVEVEATHEALRAQGSCVYETGFWDELCAGQHLLVESRA